MGSVADTKERVQAYLTKFGPVSIDSDGDFSVTSGSSRAYVSVKEHPNNDSTLVDIWAPFLHDVEMTPALFEYIALYNGRLVFGHLEIHPRKDTNTCLLVVRHRLLGDYLDQEELAYSVFGVVGSADELDDEMQSEFGGKRIADL